MTPLLSLYLDLVRFGAATVVVLHHSWQVLVPKYPLPWPGPHAVIVFFVLSGYVIAYVTDRREKTLGAYALHRCARVWSVAIPALVLSTVASAFVDPHVIYESAPATAGTVYELSLPAASPTELLLRSVANLFFVGQLWTLNITPPLNPPFWSLNYEVWYYLIYGAWVYLRGVRRSIVLIVLCATSGSNILLLLPCWLAGVWLYKYRPSMPAPAALAVFFGTILAYLVVFQFDLPALLRHEMLQRWLSLTRSLAFSNAFLGYYLIAAIVTTNFCAVANLNPYGTGLLRFQRLGPVDIPNNRLAGAAD